MEHFHAFDLRIFRVTCACEHHHTVWLSCLSSVICRVVIAVAYKTPIRCFIIIHTNCDRHVHVSLTVSFTYRISNGTMPVSRLHFVVASAIVAFVFMPDTLRADACNTRTMMGKHQPAAFAFELITLLLSCDPSGPARSFKLLTI